MYSRARKGWLYSPEARFLNKNYDEDDTSKPSFQWRRKDTLEHQKVDSLTRYPIMRFWLFLHSFMLRSVAKRDKVDAYDYKLVTSPSLYGLTISYYDAQCDTELHSFHKEAIQRMVYGLSPNLKEIHIDRGRLGGFALQFPLKPAYDWEKHWEGFTLDKKLPGTFQKGKLERIILSKSEKNITRKDLEQWSDCTDFSVLRVLKLCPHFCQIEANTLEYLLNFEFTSIETFELWMGRFSRSSFFFQPCSTSFVTATRQFLERLPALSTLKLQDWHPNLELDVLQYSNIRKLYLKPVVGSSVSLKNLNQISTYCPLLSSLDISIRRLRGNADEIEMYRALGSMARLAYLQLSLDVKDPKFRLGGYNKAVDIPSDPSFDSFDMEFYPQITLGYYKCPRKGHLRDGLINSALDADLACSIFRTINSAKPDMSVPLQKMTVGVDLAEFPDKHGDCARTRYYNLLRYLGAEWTVERNHSDLATDNLIANRVRNRGVKWSRCYPSPHDTCLDPDLGAVFRSLWPPKGNSREVKDWHSFPLATGDNEAEIEGWLNRNNLG
ncbi:hypothetical protein MGYG_05592 [Nannizzia gypsea CBS 118893]|uniref:Uncharacterized protein n=1 Tax=Arthroderma gypseum (strain ATCC MYA-4604 / CBS 118893) TaxID=535722 RepID=E4UWQ2_ARTGP|nr:hypothetical protein MGYG_05592 [Nannizzia gypsea CBS 118893]EFR02595.1 hypothetical protein MGYG_05592 [Nannizzia gypsea CBS 118893]